MALRVSLLIFWPVVKLLSLSLAKGGLTVPDRSRIRPLTSSTKRRPNCWLAPPTKWLRNFGGGWTRTNGDRSRGIYSHKKTTYHNQRQYLTVTLSATYPISFAAQYCRCLVIYCQLSPHLSPTEADWKLSV